MIYRFNRRINIYRQDQYKEYDQQKRNCMPVWLYQQAIPARIQLSLLYVQLVFL